MMQSLKFEDKEVHVFQYKGKNGCIGVELARAASIKDARGCISDFIKSKKFLVKGEDYEILSGKELLDLKQIWSVVGKNPTTFKVGTSPSLTIFFEKAIYTFAGTKNGKGFEKFQKWIDASVLRCDGHLKKVLGKFLIDFTTSPRGQNSNVLVVCYIVK